jgi:excisionase family DNA binding protein
MAEVRFNYTTVYWMWVTFGDNTCIDEAIQKAISALQNKFGQGLPVQNNYEEAKKLKPHPQEPFICSNKEKIVYGCMFGLINTTEAAKILNVNASRIRQLIADGRIKATKTGRDWMIEKSELDGYERGKPGPKPKGAPRPPHTEPVE